LSGDPVGDQFFIVIIVGIIAKDAKSIFLKWLGGGISVISRSRSSCVKLTLKRFLNEQLQGNLRLIGDSQMVPFFKRTLVYTSREEETDCIVNQLAIRVWILIQDGNLGAIFDAAEEHFGGIGGRIRAANVTSFNSIAAGVGWLQIEDNWSKILRTVMPVPARHGWAVQNLKCIVHARIECIEIRLFDVLH
jgi:hypothetical protein